MRSFSFSSVTFSYRGNASALIEACFKSSSPRYLKTYMEGVNKLDYQEKPSYDRLKKIFSDHLGQCDPMQTLEWLPQVSTHKVNQPPIMVIACVCECGGGWVCAHTCVGVNG